MDGCVREGRVVVDEVVDLDEISDGLERMVGTTKRGRGQAGVVVLAPFAKNVVLVPHRPLSFSLTETEK